MEKNEPDKQVQEKPNGTIFKKLIIPLMIASFAIGAVVVSGMVYYFVLDSYAAKEKELNAQIASLKDELFQIKLQLLTPTPIPSGTRIIHDNELPALDPEIRTCGYWKDKSFDKVYLDNGEENIAGVLSLSGYVVKREEASDWNGSEKIEKVYFVQMNPTGDKEKLFYDSYMKLIKQSNSINLAEKDQLLFRLGVVKNGELATGATISEDLKKSILALADSNIKVKLKMVIPLWVERGATDDHSFACDISQ